MDYINSYECDCFNSELNAYEEYDEYDDDAYFYKKEVEDNKNIIYIDDDDELDVDGDYDINDYDDNLYYEDDTYYINKETYKEEVILTFLENMLYMISDNVDDLENKLSAIQKLIK